jgi:hypothetical protein
MLAVLSRMSPSWILQMESPYGQLQVLALAAKGRALKGQGSGGSSSGRHLHCPAVTQAAIWQMFGSSGKMCLGQAGGDIDISAGHSLGPAKSALYLQISMSNSLEGSVFYSLCTVSDTPRIVYNM